MHSDFSVPTQQGSIELGESSGSCQGCSRTGGGMVGLMVHDATMDCFRCNGSGCRHCGDTGKGITVEVTLCGNCLKTSVGSYLRDART